MVALIAQFGGRFEPTNMVAADGGPPEIIIPGELFRIFGTGSTKNGIPALVNALRSISTSSEFWPKILRPQKIDLENWRGWIVKFQGTAPFQHSIA